jgi:hypothetical protein
VQQQQAFRPFQGENARFLPEKREFPLRATLYRSAMEV